MFVVHDDEAKECSISVVYGWAIFMMQSAGLP